MTRFRLDEALRARIAGNLAGFRPEPVDDPALRPAAVAIVVVADDAGRPSILLTRRPARMGRHAGQYALPGGRIDPGETAAEAALRELDEELGLALRPDDLVGRLDDYPTRSGFRISPFVVWAGAGQYLTPAPDEVAAVLHIPFAELDSSAIPRFEKGVEPDRPVLFSQFPTIGHRMYAPTAAVVYQFREVALHGRPTRVATYDQPRFAWR